MPLTPVAKTIKSDHGGEHQYECSAHPASEGVDLLPKVMRLLGEVIAPAFSALGGEGEQIDVGELDGDQIASAISKFATELARVGSVSLFKDILKYTTRRDDNGNLQKVPDAFDAIYQANYGELARALWFSLDTNFGPSLRASFANVALPPKVSNLAS